MPPVARQNDQFNTGHRSPPQSSLTGPSQDVFANGLGVERQGDPSVPHRHVVNIVSGSDTVFVNSKPIARVGDKIDSGTIIQGSPDVFAG